VTSSDLGLALHCQYDLGNKTVSNGLDLEVKGEIQPALVEEGKVESPTVIMSVTARGGGQVKQAAVGDPLELHFSILDQDSPYEIFVRELVAKDGNDQNEIVLLDSVGCPTEGRILGPLGMESDRPKSLMARFDAFKFPTSEVVQFRALVTPCMPKCKPVECVYQDYFGGDKTRISSYGRRRRDISLAENPLTRWRDSSRFRRSQAGLSLSDDVLVTHAFVITDKFAKKETDRGRNDVEKSSNLNKITENYYDKDSLSFSGETKTESFDPAGLEVCLNLTGLIVGVGLFLFIQLVLVFAWTHFWQSRQRKKGNLPFN